MNAEFLSAEQRALLARALEGSGRKHDREIPPRQSSGPAPLSYAQQRFWLLHNLDPSSGHCNTPAGIALEGALDREALARALADVVRRHDLLRTVFPSANGEPAQLVLPDADVPLGFTDLSTLPDAEREAAARAIFCDEARRPFDIAAEPSLRATLLRLASDRHWLIVVAHHIVFDTWSLGVFGREMFAIYDAIVQGRPPELDPLRIQYADVACWERGAAQQERLARELAIWKQRMQGAPELLRLPLAAPRRRFQDGSTNSQAFSLAPGLAPRLTAFSRSIGTSAFTVLLGGLALLLHRQSGDRDLTISSAVSTRRHRSTQALIGCFTNTLLFRIRLEGNPTVRELLDHVRAVVLEAHDTSDVPFEQVLAAVHPVRHLSYTPFAQVMFTVQDADLDVTSRSGLAISRLPLRDRVLMQQDLAFHVRVTGDGLHGLAEYNAELFDPGTVGRLLAGYEHALAALVAHPGARLSELPPAEAPAPERSAAPASPLASAPIALPHHAVERLARLDPDRVAIVSGDRHLTYREIARRAARLAARLRALGAGPEWRVAVCQHDAADAIVSLLAVLDAGAAFVPCDPASSPARLRMLARDAGVRAAIADEAYAAAFAPVNVPVLRPDVEHDTAADPESGAVRSSAPVSGHNLAWIVSTAGATGAPRIVAGTYDSLSQAIRTFAEAAGLGYDTTFVATATPSAFHWAIGLVAPLAAGARLAVARGEARGDDRALYSDIANAVAREAATAAHATPLVWRAILDAGLAPRPGFRALCSGDHLTPDLLHRFRAHGVEVTNLYGSAELGAHAMTGTPAAGEQASLGRAAGGCSVYALDEYLHPISIDRAGELYVAGPALGRGYLDRPDLTAERFVPDPFSAVPGARMYRTFDVVRRGEHGELRAVHRADATVTARGSRVALGAIEATLRVHPAVADAAVVARGAAGQERRVIAYALLRRDGAGGGAAPGRALEAEIRDFVKLQLPASHWPAEVFALDAFPIARSGRVNRRDLPDPAVLAARRPDAYVAPSSRVERAVAEVWAELLSLERVGATDDFFELGGDSLKAQRMIARVESLLQIRVPVHYAFTHPTVARLSREIERLKSINMSEDEELASFVDRLTDEEVHALLGAVGEPVEPS